MEAKKSHQYNIVRILIEQGHIQSFNSIFEYVPKTTVAKDLNIHHKTMTHRINNLDEFEIRDIIILAEWIGIDFQILAKMVIKSCK